MNTAAIGAGLADLKVKTVDGDEFDLYAAVSASADVAQDEIQINGDDTQLGTFISNIREDLTITCNGIDFDTLQAITGNTVASEASGLHVGMGTESQGNPPFVEITASTKAKDKDGVTCTLLKIWHKVQIKSVKPTQENGTEYNIEMTGTAIQTANDIEGVALASNRVSTISLQY